MTDRSTPADVLATLGLLRGHYPADHPRLDETAAAMWWDAGCSRYSPDELAMAARTWDATRRFPRSAEFVDHVRANVAASRFAEIDAVPEAPVDRDVQRGIAAAAGALAETVEPSTQVRRHDHRRGAAGCALCARHLVPAEPVLDDGLVREHPYDFAPRADGTVGCPTCGDTGWVERTDGSVRPCARCEPVLFVRWEGGHFDPGHHGCADCAEVRRGKMPAVLAEIAAGRPPSPTLPYRADVDL